MAYYFAYGSNMDKSRMLERGANIISMKRGILKGHYLTFNKIASQIGEGYANIKKNSSIVEGIIYEVDEATMSKLDVYEASPDHYKRKNVKVETDGKVQLCITYIANPNKFKEGLKPTKAYLDNLLAGKDYLSEEYYNKLKEIDTLD